MALIAALAWGGAISAQDNSAEIATHTPQAKAGTQVQRASLDGPDASLTPNPGSPGKLPKGQTENLALDYRSNPAAAFRFGYNAYKMGDTQNAVEALAFAAEGGHPAALWKLGRMYQTGDGVPKDERRAFALFSRIANEYADGNPHGPNARFVSSAFVALGAYYVVGFPGMVANEGLARRYYSYAASYYGDPEAQFRLAAMYLVGQGGSRNAVQAARWFKLAAQKGHALAQAEFGRLLFEGLDGFTRSPVKGLMWLSIANASGGDDPHIRVAHDHAFALADEKQRHSATMLAREWQADNP